MSMPQGLIKSTAYWNNVEARRDWLALADKAVQAGVSPDFVNELAPAPDAGWRKIDKAIVKLRAKIEKVDSDFMIQEVMNA